MRPDNGCDLLEECLARLQAGEPVEKILASYPEQAAEIRPLLEAALAARALRIQPAQFSGAQARSRAQFLQSARRTPTRSWIPPSAFSARRWLSGVMAALLLTMVGTGIVSAQSLPGDSLYPVKRAAENVRLQLVSDPAQRITIEQGYDQERVNEVDALLASQRSVEVDFAGILEINPDTGGWQVSHLNLVIPKEVTIPSDLKPGRYAQVDGDLMPDHTIVVEKISLRIDRIVGTLEQKGAGVWSVDQVPVQINASTQIQGTLQPGSQVNAQVYRGEDGNLHAYSLDAENPSATQANQNTLTPEREVQPSVAPRPSSQPAETGQPSQPQETSQSENTPAVQSDHQEAPQEAPPAGDQNTTHDSNLESSQAGETAQQARPAPQDHPENGRSTPASGHSEQQNKTPASPEN